jgi:hypothetical protein
VHTAGVVGDDDLGVGEHRRQVAELQARDRDPHVAGDRRDELRLALGARHHDRQPVVDESPDDGGEPLGGPASRRAARAGGHDGVAGEVEGGGDVGVEGDAGVQRVPLRGHAHGGEQAEHAVDLVHLVGRRRHPVGQQGAAELLRRAHPDADAGAARELGSRPRRLRERREDDRGVVVAGGELGDEVGVRVGARDEVELLPRHRGGDDVVDLGEQGGGRRAAG